MACSSELVVEQAAGTGEAASRRMFGDYMVYVDKKPLLLCGNTAYVKTLDCVKGQLSSADIAVPYGGAKPHYVLDVGDRELVCRVIELLKPHVPAPRPRKRK